MTKHKIIWEYWQNPFGGMGPEFVSEENAEVPHAWDNKDEVEDKETDVRPVIPTPMGFFPIKPFRNFTDNFEFWMGHTNFYITQQAKESIEFSEGVEVFDVFSPYRFRIGVGKAFEGKEVKYRIQEVLQALPPKKGELNPNDMKLDKDTKEKLALLQSTIKDKFPFWAVYVMPNGEIDVAGTNSQDGYDMHLELYKNAQELVGGVIYQYA